MSYQLKSYIKFYIRGAIQKNPQKGKIWREIKWPNGQRAAQWSCQALQNLVVVRNYPQIPKTEDSSRLGHLRPLSTQGLHVAYKVLHEQLPHLSTFIFYWTDCPSSSSHTEWLPCRFLNESSSLPPPGQHCSSSTIFITPTSNFSLEVLGLRSQGSKEPFLLVRELPRLVCSHSTLFAVSLWPWAGHSSSPSVSFQVCKMRIAISALHSHCQDEIRSCMWTTKHNGGLLGSVQ